SIDELRTWAQENVKLINILTLEKKREVVTISLIDILEEEVEEKFYLTKEKMDNFVYKENYEQTEIDLEPSINVIGNTSNTGHRSHDVHDVDGISPTIAARDYKGPKQIAIKENTKKGYVEATEGDGVRLEQIGGTTGRGRVQKKSSPTLTTSGNVGAVTEDLRIRKLTPKECFRLQGFPDELFDRAQKVNSDSQLYKQAGNSVTVNVIHAIAKKF